MDFSKEQIISKSFSKKWTGGLNEFEVRDFLHVLAEQIRHLEQENLLLKKDLLDKESLVKDYRDREHILKESIASAESWAQKIKQEAESRRQLVLEKAQSDSESLIESARQSLQTVYRDIADLKRLQLQFKTGLKAALQVQMDLLEEDSLFNPLLADKDSANKALGSENKDISPQNSKPLPEKSKSPLDHSSSDESQNKAFGSEETAHPEAMKGSSSPPETEKGEGSAEINSLRESLNSLNKNFS